MINPVIIGLRGSNWQECWSFFRSGFLPSNLKYIGGGLLAKSCPTLATPWTIAGQVPLSMGFSRQEYWSGLPFPSPGDLPKPGIEPGSPTLAGSLPTELQGKLVEGFKYIEDALKALALRTTFKWQKSICQSHLKQTNKNTLTVGGCF